MPGVHAEVLLAGGYVAFLMAIAIGLELLARHSYRRSQRQPTAGFMYRRHFDAWECPTGNLLLRREVDCQAQIVRYRAPAHTCNACSLKQDCTDSDQGREIVHSSESWLETEIGRFHRGISLALLVLAGFILIVEEFRYHDPKEMVLLGGALALVGVAGVRAASAQWSKAK